METKRNNERKGTSVNVAECFSNTENDNDLMDVLLSMSEMNEKSDDELEGADIADQEFHCQLKDNATIHIEDGFDSDEI